MFVCLFCFGVVVFSLPQDFKSNNQNWIVVAVFHSVPFLLPHLTPTGHSSWLPLPEAGSSSYKGDFPSHCCQDLAHRGLLGFLAIIVGAIPYSIKHLGVLVGHYIR